jgi:cytochrome c-type biogenesis protein CcmH
LQYTGWIVPGRGSPAAFSGLEVPRMIATFVALGLSLAVAAGPDPQVLEQQARELEAKLIAPCCWMQQVSLHQSPASDEIKKNIRVMLAAGQTSQQILDAYVAQYGDRILAEPPARGFSAALYVLPWILLAGSVGLVVFIVRRLRTPAAEPGRRAEPGAMNESENERIDEELRNLE